MEKLRIENKHNLTKEILEQDYKELGSITAVANKYKADRHSMSDAFARLGIDYKMYPNTLPVNHNYFSNPFENTQALYWIGFLMADGNIYKKEVQLGLSQKDEDHLIKFKQDLESKHKISHSVIKSTNEKWKDSFACHLQITSLKMIEDLSKFNIIPRKTFLSKFPELVKNSDYANIYCRGYVDGDGCWTFDKKKGIASKQLKFNVVGTNDFLREFNNVLVKGAELPIRCLSKTINFYKNIGLLSYSGNIICSKIAKWIYKDVLLDEYNSRFLQRKYDIVKNYIIGEIKECNKGLYV